MRYLERRTRTRPHCRVDSTRPMRQAMEVAARDSERLGAERLAEAVIALRAERSLSQEDLAALCGIALKTVQRIEKGRVAPRATTFGAIDRGAGWKPGSARALVRDGTPPQPLNASGDVSRSAREEAELRLAKIKARFPEEYELAMRAVRELNDDAVEQIVTD